MAFVEGELHGKELRVHPNQTPLGLLFEGRAEGTSCSMYTLCRARTVWVFRSRVVPAQRTVLLRETVQVLRAATLSIHAQPLLS
jgi:hypothetical protein